MLQGNLDFRSCIPTSRPNFIRAGIFSPSKLHITFAQEISLFSYLEVISLKFILCNFDSVVSTCKNLSNSSIFSPFLLYNSRFIEKLQGEKFGYMIRLVYSLFLVKSGMYIDES